MLVFRMESIVEGMNGQWPV